jgi:hypothetical protein
VEGGSEGVVGSATLASAHETHFVLSGASSDEGSLLSICLFCMNVLQMSSHWMPVYQGGCWVRPPLDWCRCLKCVALYIFCCR